MKLEELKSELGENLKFVNPNFLSLLALIFSLEIGYFFLDSNKQPFLYIWIIILIGFRLLINWITKQVVIARGDENNKSWKIYYAIADRYSDLFIFGGFMLSRLTDIFLGYFGFISCLLVSFAGVYGKSEGVDYEKHGPMNKCGRMIFIALIALIEYIGIKCGKTYMIYNYENAILFSWQDLGAVILIILAQITVFRRILAIRKQIMEDETKQW